MTTQEPNQYIQEEIMGGCVHEWPSDIPGVVCNKCGYIVYETQSIPDAPDFTSESRSDFWRLLRELPDDSLREFVEWFIKNYILAVTRTDTAVEIFKRFKPSFICAVLVEWDRQRKEKRK